MRLDQSLHAAAQRLVEQRAALTRADVVDTRQSECRSDDSYEPACVMTWKTQVAAMDETAGLA